MRFSSTASQLSDESMAGIEKLLSKSSLTFDDISEDFVVRMMLDTLKTCRRPQVAHQLLRTLAEIKGMISAHKTKGAGVAAAEDALHRLGAPSQRRS